MGAGDAFLRIQNLFLKELNLSSLLLILPGFWSMKYSVKAAWNLALAKASSSLISRSSVLQYFPRWVYCAWLRLQYLAIWICLFLLAIKIIEYHFSSIWHLDTDWKNLCNWQILSNFKEIWYSTITLVLAISILSFCFPGLINKNPTVWQFFKYLEKVSYEKFFSDILYLWEVRKFCDDPASRWAILPPSDLFTFIDFSFWLPQIKSGRIHWNLIRES